MGNILLYLGLKKERWAPIRLGIKRGSGITEWQTERNDRIGMEIKRGMAEAEWE